MTERPEHPLTRDDFLSAEDWNRYCHEGGLQPWDNEDEPEWQCPDGQGPSSELARAIFGHTERQHAMTWQRYGLSSYLTMDQLRKAYGGVELANRRGLVLDRHLTVTWSTLGFWEDHSILFLQKRLLELFRKWLLNRGCSPAWLWVMEHGRKRGLHTHLMISIPSEHHREFRAYVEQAVETVCGKPPVTKGREKTVKLTGGGPVSVERQWRLFKYLFKGLHPGAEIRNGITDWKWVSFAEFMGIEACEQGEVLVKRMGLSRDLDSAAQVAWRVSGGPSAGLDGLLSPSETFDDRFYRWFLQIRWG